MAEQKKPSAFDGVGGKTTPVLIDKLPPEVQAALRRQASYTLTSGHVRSENYPSAPLQSGPPKPLSAQNMNTGVVESNAAADAAILRKHGLQGRVVLVGPKPGATGTREAFAIDTDGRVAQVAERRTWDTGYGYRPDHAETRSAGGLSSSRVDGASKVPGRTVGAISASRQGIKLPPKMTARGMSILDAGPAMYQLMTDNVDTDFTVKMIPPQFRKPDETGKMREAVVIVDGQPFVQYEGEAFNIPGFEDVGDELASYFREHSSEAMGKNKLGADVAGTSMEVRESEKQAMDKKVQAGAQEAAGSSGPRKGGAPTFAGEYQVGRKSAEPRLPKTDEVLRKMN